MQSLHFFREPTTTLTTTNYVQWTKSERFEFNPEYQSSAQYSTESASNNRKLYQQQLLSVHGGVSNIQYYEQYNTSQYKYAASNAAASYAQVRHFSLSVLSLSQFCPPNHNIFLSLYWLYSNSNKNSNTNSTSSNTNIQNLTTTQQQQQQQSMGFQEAQTDFGNQINLTSLRNQNDLTSLRQIALTPPQTPPNLKSKLNSFWHLLDAFVHLYKKNRTLTR